MKAKTVYIKKNPEPLIIENYEVCDSDFEGIKLDKGNQWHLYQDRRQTFLKLGRLVDKELRKGKGCSRELWERYTAAKNTFLIVQGALNEEFSKYAT